MMVNWKAMKHIRLSLCQVVLILLTVDTNAKSILRDNREDYCYTEDENPYLLTGSRTPYPSITHGITNLTIPDCKPVLVWGFFRHGTRYPSGEEIKDIRGVLPELRDYIIKNHENQKKGSLCNVDLEMLKNWTFDPNITVEKKKILSKQGEIDLESIGQRFQNSFSNILFPDESDMSLNDYEFKTSQKERAISSMRFFMKGLFGNRTISHPVQAPIIDQKMLRPYETCKLWYKSFNDTSLNREIDAFRNGPVYQKLIHEISVRLGFTKDLEPKTIETIYDACAFEKALAKNETSPWCAVFKKDHMRALEYHRDLFSYYHGGYGFNISKHLGCPILHNMFDHFIKLEKGLENQPKGVFLFSHSGSLNMLYTSLGIFEDPSPLTAANYEIARDRKWRTSLMTPLAMNIIAVFYKCGSSNKVRFYAAEKPLDYDGCDNGICDWEYLKEKLQPFANNCALHLCDN